MSDEVNLQSLYDMLATLCKRKNLFVLGAGASYPDSPTTAQLKSLIIPQWLNVGSYPLAHSTQTETFERVIGTLNKSTFDERTQLYLELLRGNPDALDWLISYQLSINFNKRLPPNYAVFWTFPCGSVILNFNLDQYANHLRPYHIVLEPHGRIPANLRQIFSERDIAEYAEFETPIPWKNRTILIRPENHRILASKEYEYLISNWALFQDVVIIGYSFSRFGDTFDDLTTFEFLCEMIKYYNNHVVLLDPYPDQTACIIQSEIRQRIVVGRFKWNSLSAALLINMRGSGINSVVENPNAILRTYRELEHKNV